MSKAKERFKTISGHITGYRYDQGGESLVKEPSTAPLKRNDLLKWNGWGYKDSGFVYDHKREKFQFMGTRYDIGGKNLPYFKNWVQSVLSVDLSHQPDSKTTIEASEVPDPVVMDTFMQALEKTRIQFSNDGPDRVFRSHGHCLHEIFNLRKKKLPLRVPDLVVMPKNHEEVMKVVQLAHENDVVIIPFGGGTSVSGALECPENEKRMIVSLDTSQMSKILWVDHMNFTAHVEAGIIGQDLERQLACHNLCTGHEPDSFEFSSLGGWVATRASGMKKNIYGNIEDLVILIKMVTPLGTIERNCRVPRISAGPDIHQLILGSEGTLGVITEVTIKVRPLPECRRYNSIVFPCFEKGFEFMRDIARHRLKPASVRLMDNQQFVFGLALKPEAESQWNYLKDYFKKLYVIKFKGFSTMDMCVATILMEGEEEEVNALESKLLDLGTKHNGLVAGEDNGRRGYTLTFVIAYIRDLGLDYDVVAESFETSVPWDRCLDLCKNVKDCIKLKVESHGIKKPVLITYRLTQTYDAGACIYFYFAFNYQGLNKNPVEVFHDIENAAREEIFASGGSISHHHGVGKIRKRWLKDTVSEAGLEAIRSVKKSLDPKNIFACGNLLD